MICTSRTSAAIVLIAALALWLLPSVPAGGTAQHAAGLVIDTGERVVTVYVEFPEGAETITGEELLRLADVDAVFADYGSMGKAVCSILGVGSPQDDCFREAERNGLYWNYSQAEDGGWRRSSRGVSSTTVEHGDVDGWAWGPQGSTPPYHSFEEIRARHASDPDPTPTPSATTSRSPDPTPERSSSHEPTAGTTAQQEPAIPEQEPATRTTRSHEDQDEGSAAESGTPASQAPSPAPTSDPIADATSERESEEPTEQASPHDGVSDVSDPSPIAAEPVVQTGGAWSLLIFLAVMGALLGGIVWRRRARSGTGQAPPPT